MEVGNAWTHGQCCTGVTYVQGVVFSGTVRHSGRAVSEGLRYLLVASFTITGEGDESKYM